MEAGQLQTIIIPENNVVWMDKHEIWINGSMFDIESSELANGVYTFTGMYDEEETLLVQEEKETEEEESKHQKLLTQLFKSFAGYFSSSAEDNSLSSIQHEYSSLISTKPVSPFREIQTPPPQA